MDAAAPTIAVFSKRDCFVASQQALETDFLKGCLRRIEEQRMARDMILTATDQ